MAVDVLQSRLHYGGQRHVAYAHAKTCLAAAAAAATGQHSGFPPFHQQVCPVSRLCVAMKTTGAQLVKRFRGGQLGGTQ